MEGRRQCKGMFSRFTFNAEVGRCEEFVYGGQFDSLVSLGVIESDGKVVLKDVEEERTCSSASLSVSVSV